MSDMRRVGSTQGPVQIEHSIVLHCSDRPVFKRDVLTTSDRLVEVRLLLHGPEGCFCKNLLNFAFVFNGPLH